MTEQLQRWIDDNFLVVEELQNDGVNILSIEGVGKFLYVLPVDGVIIDEDFGFVLSDDEFDILDEKLVDYILFEFGGKFYYSGLKTDKSRYNDLIYKPEFNDFKYLGKSSEPELLDFVHLGVHDEYEILNGSASADVWAKKAKFLGVKALGCCNLNSLAGSLAFQGSCQKHGVKPIIGETITIARDYKEESEVHDTYELKLYVLNQNGWFCLLELNRLLNVTYNGVIPEEVFFKKKAHGLACVITPNTKHELDLYNRLLDHFTHIYYQIDTVEYKSDSLFREHLRKIDNYLCNYRELFEPILINDSYYLDAECYELKSMLNRISGKISGESSNQYFKTVRETIDAYSLWIDDVRPLADAIVTGLQNAAELAETADFVINTGERKLPSFEVEDVQSFFYEQLVIGVNDRLSHLSKSDMEIYMERLQTECEVIVPNGLCDYFMILWDICAWCRQNDINVGPGRGSVCGSLIAYLLYITDVDPIPYGLMFERFLNETRVSGERAKSADSMPDIDVDFPTAHRDSVKAYIEQKYGQSFVCAIGTYTRMKLKTCLKDFAKVKGISFDTMNKLTKDIDDQIEYTWGDLIEYATKSKALFKFVQEYPELVHMTKYALLQPRAESVHPSAVIITPKQTTEGKSIDIYKWMPVKNIGGVLVSEWEGKYIDKSGFLKEDILGLKELDKFKGMVRLIKKHTGKLIDVNTIPLDDEEVFKVFKRGWCEDVFQFGTASLQNYCRQVCPDNFEHLVAMTAVFRPGPMKSGAHEDFALIKNGKKKPHYDFGLREVTEVTGGLYIYQEQVMKAVNVLGGLTLVQADQLRTYMKKKDHKSMAALAEQFIAGAVEKGCGEKEAKEIWEKLDKFSGYGFNRSHAVAYTLMSYWGQWFKINYPLEFWTTSLQWSNEEDIPYRIAEMKKLELDVEVSPPDVNYSANNFTCDPKVNKIFFSLEKIKGVGAVAVGEIMRIRDEGGEFFSLEEFVSRVPSKVNKKVITCLILAGAFDILEGINAPRRRIELLEKYLVDLRGETVPEEYYSEDAQMNAFWIFEQKRLTGFGEVDYQSMLKDSIPSKRVASLYIPAIEFANSKEEREVTIVGKVLFCNVRTIKNGTMCTLNIDSNNTIINVTLWPDIWEDLKEDPMTLKGRVIAVNGRVKKDKYKNQKGLYSFERTKLYIIS